MAPPFGWDDGKEKPPARWPGYVVAAVFLLVVVAFPAVLIGHLLGYFPPEGWPSSGPALVAYLLGF
jgi:hypothetical protein